MTFLPTRTAPMLLLLLGWAPAPSAAQQPASCRAPEHRAFDFWVGRWEVTARGQVAGHNVITSELGGCVLHERYTTPRGYEGESLNVYDAARGVWHQTWVDNAGTLLVLEGSLRDGAMVLEGTTLAADGSTTVQRITWSRVDGDADRVRQHWQSSSDGGATWSTVFDGLYQRVEDVPSARIRRW